MLTIAYFTSRKNPAIEWFFHSLHHELKGDYTGVRLVVVDFWSQSLPHLNWTQQDADGRRMHWKYRLMPDNTIDALFVPPKPNPWNGQYKLPKDDWWAASSARNTAVCLAPDGWLAFVDDVSVLVPGWGDEVRRVMAGDPKRVCCGSYRKVFELVVENGNIVSYRDNPSGHDNRWGTGSDDGAVSCGPNWLYGCSLIAPVEGFLEINGWNEALCQGLGFEDVITGIQLSKKGYTFEYSRKMHTLESEELHSQEPIIKRSDYGVSPDDKSHAVLRIAQEGDGWHPNYFGEEGLRGLRRRILAGAEFPICQIPEHEWYTGKPLREL